jgi:hypothetical protein
MRLSIKFLASDFKHAKKHLFSFLRAEYYLDQFLSFFKLFYRYQL